MIFEEHENEKKREYEQRVLEVEMNTSPPPLVFGTNGGMGIEFHVFLKQPAVKLVEKDQERCSVVISWLRTGLSFKIIRAVHVSVRGTSLPFH